MPGDKERILEIIKEGIESAENLNHKDLKEGILGHFHAIEKYAKEDMHLDKLEPLVKELMIGVKEALCFNDLEILEEVEISVREKIDYLNR